MQVQTSEKNASGQGQNDTVTLTTSEQL